MFKFLGNCTFTNIVICGITLSGYSKLKIWPFKNTLLKLIKLYFFVISKLHILILRSKIKCPSLWNIKINIKALNLSLYRPSYRHRIPFLFNFRDLGTVASKNKGLCWKKGLFKKNTFCRATYEGKKISGGEIILLTW